MIYMADLAKGDSNDDGDFHEESPQPVTVAAIAVGVR